MAGPFGSTPPAVRKLALDVAAEGVRVGTRAPRVDDDTVDQWLTQGGGIVASKLRGYRQLPDPPAAPGGLTPADVEAAARGLVELYAASLLADVTHPERARTSEGYGSMLYKRYLDGLAALAGDVAAALETSAYGSGGGAVCAPPSPQFLTRGF